jgi:hypothetical protein
MPVIGWEKGVCVLARRRDRMARHGVSSRRRRNLQNGPRGTSNLDRTIVNGAVDRTGTYFEMIFGDMKGMGWGRE